MPRWLAVWETGYSACWCRVWLRPRRQRPPAHQWNITAHQQRVRPDRQESKHDAQDQTQPIRLGQISTGGEEIQSLQLPEFAEIAGRPCESFRLLRLPVARNHAFPQFGTQPTHVWKGRALITVQPILKFFETIPFFANDDGAGQEWCWPVFMYVMGVLEPRLKDSHGFAATSQPAFQQSSPPYRG